MSHLDLLFNSITTQGKLFTTGEHHFEAAEE